MENLIFARAAHLKTTVHAKEGGLISASRDLELQTLIYVYNVNFRAENFATYCTAQDALEQRQHFLAQRVCPPGLTRIYSAKELNFELILSEGK